MRSSADGAIRSRIALGGLNPVSIKPNEAKISRWQKESSDSAASRSRAIPRMMNPISLYSACEPGSATSGMVRAECNNSSRVRLCINSFPYAGNPEECARRVWNVTPSRAAKRTQEQGMRRARLDREDHAGTVALPYSWSLRPWLARPDRKGPNRLRLVNPLRT